MDKSLVFNVTSAVTKFHVYWYSGSNRVKPNNVFVNIGAMVIELRVFNKKEKKKKKKNMDKMDFGQSGTLMIVIFGTQLSFDMCCAVKS